MGVGRPPAGWATGSGGGFTPPQRPGEPSTEAGGPAGGLQAHPRSMSFLAVLALGLLYVWKKGALEWE